MYNRSKYGKAIKVLNYIRLPDHHKKDENQNNNINLTNSKLLLYSGKNFKTIFKKCFLLKIVK